MATVKKTIGKVPVGRGNYSSNTVYYKENTVTLFGMSFRALTDIAAGVAPAVVENNKAKLTNTDKWQLIAGAPEIYSATSQLNQNTERIANNANAIGALAQKTEQEHTALVNGDTIVGLAREVYSRQGKSDTATFLKRTTAGGTTISDGVASIKQIGGNILKNLVDGVGFTTTNQALFTTNKNGVVTTKENSADLVLWYSLENNYAIKNHIYYIAANVYNENAKSVTFAVQTDGSGTQNEVRGEWQWISHRKNVDHNYEHVVYKPFIRVDYGDGFGTTVHLKNWLVIDLTEMYGAGKEPTIEECDRMFASMGALPQGLTVAQPTALKSVGFNQWNPNNIIAGKSVADGVLADNEGTSIAFIECLPCKLGAGENNGYVIGSGEGEEWSDSGIEVYLSPLNPLETEGELYLSKLEKDATHNTYLPGIAGYLLVVTPTTDQLCAHLHWSGDRAVTDYEPYNESTVQLPEIPQMSEWGLAGIAVNGTMAQDVIDLENNKYTKRIGCAYLRDYYWSQVFTTDGIQIWRCSTIPAVNAQNEIVCNFMSNVYTSVSQKNRIDMTISRSGADTDIIDNRFTNENDFNNYMQNCNGILYYEMRTLEEYPIVTKATPNYIGSDYGVEQFSGSKVPLAANFLFYMRSLVSETRNFLDRLMAGLGSDVTAVADKIIAAVNTVNAPAEEVDEEGEQMEE